VNSGFAGLAGDVKGFGSRIWLAPGLWAAVPSLCPGSATSGGCSKTKFSIGKSLSPPTVAPVAGVAGLIVSVASVVPGALSTAICSGLPVPRGPAHPLSHGQQITRDHLRRIDPGCGGTGG